MPSKPKRPCRYPGCRRLSDEPYCEEHRKAARNAYNKYERSPDSNKNTAERGNESETDTLRLILYANAVLRKADTRPLTKCIISCRSAREEITEKAT